MKKLVFISNIPAPYQVKFCYQLNEFYNTEFWFYDNAKERGPLWETELGEKCRIIPEVPIKNNGRFFTTKHISWLKKFNPDIVMLGGFSIPANYLAYRWAKKNGKKTVLLTEVSRDVKGVLRKQSWQWKMLRSLYKGIDAVFALTEDSYTQFKEELGFGEKVKQAHYAYDLSPYLKHEGRANKDNTRTVLFANRLTSLYNPLMAIDIVKKVIASYPETKMKMNGNGELRGKCEALIKEYGLGDKVSFLDNIPSWDQLHEVYAASDIFILPAGFSNGNFTIYEAMASGMGIVISNLVLGNGKRIVNGENGYSLSLDVALFAEKIIAYIEDPNLFEQHAAKNRKLIDNLGLNKTAAHYAKLLNDI